MDLSPDALVGIKVVIVADDVSFLRLLYRPVHEAGCRVSVAHKDRPALAETMQTRPDVVITNMLTSNPEVIGTIASLKAGAPEVKVLAISAGGPRDRADVTDLAVRLGADAVLFKPFRSAQLIDAVRKLIGRSIPVGAENGLARTLSV